MSAKILSSAKIAKNNGIWRSWEQTALKTVAMVKHRGSIPPDTVTWLCMLNGKANELKIH